MKISPVQGTPTIANPTSTGLSPEKIIRLKAIAAGQRPEEEKPEEAGLVKPVTPSMPSITMKTTPEAMQEVVPHETESAISDTVVQTPPATEATEPLSPQFAALARNRRALQQERMAFEKEKASILANAKSEFETRLKSNALSVLQEYGVNYDQLTNEILASQGNQNPEVEKLKAEIKALKEGVDKRFSDTEIAQESHAINYVADKLDGIMASQANDFELIKEMGDDGQEEVIRRVYDHWKKTGKELDVLEVAKKYESELEEETLRFAKLKKVLAKLTPQQAPLQPQPQSGMKTLTNKDSARPVVGRRQRAILAMQGQLPKG